MIISLNWLKEYVDIDVPTDELATLIGARLVEIEEMVDLAPKYKDCLVVKVEKCEPVEGSDHLSVCQINYAGDDLMQVVCGANNVHTGMLAVWLPPESIVPETYGSNDEFVLGVRKLKGFESNGMLASLRELGLGDDHDGILELNDDIAKPGDSFAEIYGLNDVLFDIENKSLTHRPDCFGIIGFAREVAGILGKEFCTPEWLGEGRRLAPELGDSSADTVGLKVTVRDPELCPRYQAVVLDRSRFMTHGLSSSPLDISLKLIKSGMRSIDPIVDMTNYLMLLTGQPLHAFDYNKLVAVGGKETPEIIVRAAKAGEKIELLDGKTAEMNENDIVITSNDVPVALAGAMGGANTAIDENTKMIVLESATFSLYNLRRTQMKHGIFSEAITRFTKGQPPELTEPVLCRFAYNMRQYMSPASAVIDDYAKRLDNQSIEIGEKDINGLLGTSYTYEQIEQVLRNVGFVVSCKCGEENKCKCERVEVVAPYWRTDIHIKEDIIEEIGRLGGFDNVKMDLPVRRFDAVNPDKLGDIKAKIRDTLSSAGANEVLTYSFVNSDLLEKSGQEKENSYQIINSISPDLEYCRQSLTPSLLEKTYMNLKAGFDKFALFEINKISQKSDELNDEKVPVEKNKVALTFVDKKAKDDAYYTAKKYVEFLLKSFGVRAEFRPLEPISAVAKPFEDKRAAGIYDKKSGQVLGVVGEYKSSVRKNFKLPESTAGFELGIEYLQGVMSNNAYEYEPLSKYPSVERDICFKVASGVTFSEVDRSVRGIMEDKNLKYEIAPIDIYQGDNKTVKNITVRVVFSSAEKTLSSDDISDVVKCIEDSVVRGLEAEVV
jgi:phenylalanyl-tRNA synthetase, beta subunit, non-spirochete bacterial